MAHESTEAVDRMFGRLVREFGGDDAGRIARVLSEEIGGMRLTFPDPRDLERIARNQVIRAGFNGRNYDELALRFDLHPSQIRRIVSQSV